MPPLESACHPGGFESNSALRIGSAIQLLTPPWELFVRCLAAGGTARACMPPDRAKKGRAWGLSRPGLDRTEWQTRSGFSSVNPAHSHHDDANSCKQSADFEFMKFITRLE